MIYLIKDLSPEYNRTILIEEQKISQLKNRHMTSSKDNSKKNNINN